MAEENRSILDLQAKVILEHLSKDISIKDLAKKHQVHPDLIRQWKKLFLENTFNSSESKREDRNSGAKIIKLRNIAISFNLVSLITIILVATPIVFGVGIEYNKINNSIDVLMEKTKNIESKLDTKLEPLINRVSIIETKLDSI